MPDMPVPPPLPGQPPAPVPNPAAAYAVAPLPIPGQLPAGNFGQQAQAMMNPIFADAAARQAANADALTRAVSDQQNMLQGQNADMASKLGISSQGLQQLNAIPNEALQNITNRSIGFNQAQTAGLQGAQTAQTAGLANSLEKQSYAGKMASQAQQAKMNVLGAEAKLRSASAGGRSSGGAGRAGSTLYNFTLPNGQTVQVTGDQAANLSLGFGKQNATETAAQAGNLSNALGMLNAKDAAGKPLYDPNVALSTIKSLYGDATASAAEKLLGLGGAGTGNSLTVNGKQVPSLTNLVPQGQQSDALRRALDDYQLNANPGNRAATMQAIEKTFGKVIADQVRQTAGAAGDLSPYLIPLTGFEKLFGIEPGIPKTQGDPGQSYLRNFS